MVQPNLQFDKLDNALNLQSIQLFFNLCSHGIWNKMGYKESWTTFWIYDNLCLVTLHCSEYRVWYRSSTSGILHCFTCQLRQTIRSQLQPSRVGQLPAATLSGNFTLCPAIITLTSHCTTTLNGSPKYVMSMVFVTWRGVSTNIVLYICSNIRRRSTCIQLLVK